jgi:hypothetical protein
MPQLGHDLLWRKRLFGIFRLLPVSQPLYSTGTEIAGQVSHGYRRHLEIST